MLQIKLFLPDCFLGLSTGLFWALKAVGVLERGRHLLCEVGVQGKFRGELMKVLVKLKGPWWLEMGAWEQ